MLINRNITVDGHRTSIRLEPEFWDGLADIAQREHQTVDELCTEVDHGAGGLSRTAAIRVFITSYMTQRAAEQLQRQFATVASGQGEARGVDEYPIAATTRYRAAG